MFPVNINEDTKKTEETQGTIITITILIKIILMQIMSPMKRQLNI